MSTTTQEVFPADRKSAPTDTVDHGSQFSFRIWANKPSYDEDHCPWKCVAMFYFLNEALEYVSDRQAEGCDVVFQSPAHTTLRKHTDRNVVSGRHGSKG